MQRMLIIQTAFIGDVILATPVIEKLHLFYPEAKIDFLLRKGNEGLLANHPILNEVIIWDKKNGKYKELYKTIRTVRKNKYDLVVNLQRFLSSGLITSFSAAKQTIGFDKNPLSSMFNQSLPHIIGSAEKQCHEIERNLSLIEHLTDGSVVKPKLYPSVADYEAVKRATPYICIAPTSVWFTKQLPAKKWIELIDSLDPEVSVLLLGGREDYNACKEIIENSKHEHAENLAGKLSFLESCALMQNAQMNYVNDSAPLHLASATNAAVTAVFCSTIPEFGFGPLSDNYRIVQAKERLDCRPCGLHGFKSCPKGHFKCAKVSFN